MPDLIATLTHGLRGLTRAAVNADPVDPETLQRRRRTCAACPAATRTKHLGRVDLAVLTPTSTCTACRCHIHAKTRLADEACPRGKW